MSAADPRRKILASLPRSPVLADALKDTEKWNIAICEFVPDACVSEWHHGSCHRSRSWGPGRRPDERKEGQTMTDGRANRGAVTSNDCFFRRRNLCALGLENPCPTFRPDDPAGLVPPAQAELRPRGGDQVAIGAVVQHQAA
jgi:hypothetical protein